MIYFNRVPYISLLRKVRVYRLLICLLGGFSESTKVAMLNGIEYMVVRSDLKQNIYVEQ